MIKKWEWYIKWKVDNSFEDSNSVTKVISEVLKYNSALTKLYLGGDEKEERNRKNKIKKIIIIINKQIND